MKLGLSLVSLAGGLLVAAAHASEPVALSEAQMDAVTAGGVERVDGFVCPVIKTDAVLNSPRGMAIGEEHYTVIGPDVAVPVHATNDNGEGTPPGPHAAPGDRAYTAIWGPGPQ